MVDMLRQEAWHYGRCLRDQLISQYCFEYGVEVPPAPALIVDELLTDFMGVILRYDPLSTNVYAQTEWKEGHTVVTVNSLTGKIPGVKDAAGVENVAKLHEAVHVDRDLVSLKPGPQQALPGFGSPDKIVCHRSASHYRAHRPRQKSRGQEDGVYREFWAEEAGRAAAVSYAALARSHAFRAFMRLRQASTITANRERWRLLYLAAEDIGVNISALVKQLELEGQIVVEQEGGRQVMYPQPALFSSPEGG